jgi:hypothetical protein
MDIILMACQIFMNLIGHMKNCLLFHTADHACF